MTLKELLDKVSELCNDETKDLEVHSDDNEYGMYEVETLEKRELPVNDYRKKPFIFIYIG